MFSEKSVVNNVQQLSKNTIFCNTEPNAKLKLANASDRHSKLSGHDRVPNSNIDKHINSKTPRKIGSKLIANVENCNLLTDSITEQYRDQIIDHPIGSNFLADDDMIKSERSMFNLDIGIPINDLDTVISKIDKDLDEQQRDAHVRVLTNKISAFSDILPLQAAKVPPFMIKPKVGHKLRNQKTRKLSSLELVSFCKSEISKLIKIKVICHSSSPVGSPIVLAKKPSVVPNVKNYRMCADYKDTNLNTEHRGCSIPNIRSSLHILKGKKYFAKLDLTMGYHQCLVDKSCRWMLAINTICGKFEFIRVPLGPQQAPGYF
jgi:hypothetical protein